MDTVAFGQLWLPNNAAFCRMLPGYPISQMANPGFVPLYILVARSCYEREVCSPASTPQKSVKEVPVRLLTCRECCLERLGSGIGHADPVGEQFGAHFGF